MDLFSNDLLHNYIKLPCISCLLFLTGNEDAGMHGDVDADEKERDDILREQVHVQ